MRTFSIYVKTLSTSTLMQMRKAELVEYVRMCEKNMADAYATLDQQAANFKKLLDEKITADQWIPCSMGKPQTMLNVLITCDEGGVWEAYRGRNGIWTNDDWLYLKDEQVIAWRFKPEPYKGVE